MRLIEKDGLVTGAKCVDGEIYEGDIFISDVHPAVTCNMICNSRKIKNTYRNRICSLENTFGMFTVSLRIKPHTIKYFNHNHYVYRHSDVWTFYQENDSIDGIMISCRVPEDGNEYTSQIDILTPMTWDKCEKWNHTTVGRRDDEYLSMKARIADECIKLATRIIPELNVCVDEIYTSSPLTYRDYINAPKGSAYGLRKDYGNPLLTMLSPRTPIPNLLLTGQSLILHGLHGVTMTALYTCAEIMGKEKIWNIINDN
ncbi:MAG: hypothetical protein Q4D41_12900 [Prevotellaceae bacterium]|nr:hypothetical protein [Prevotellaceae bacterium]